MKSSTIIIFGDSVSYGTGSAGNNWGLMLNKYLLSKLESEDRYYELYNLSVPGETSGKLLSRVVGELIPRLRTDEVIIFIAIGINDSQKYIDSGEFITRPIDFENNVTKVVEAIKPRVNKIYLLGINPVNEEKTHPVIWRPNKLQSNENIIKYNKLLKKVSVKENICYINIYNELMSAGPSFTLSDGFHPNEEGHKIIFKKIIERFKNGD